MSDEIQVVDPAAIEPTEPVSGLLERTALHAGGRGLVVFRVDDETARFRREGTTYGWVRAGHGTVARPDDERPAELSAGDFLKIPAGTTRRYVAESTSLDVLVVVDGEPEPTGTDSRIAVGEGSLSVVGPDELEPTAESPELTRETPFPDEDVLPMRVRAAGGAAAGWHHHSENVYFGYAVDGPSETEYGPDGERVARIERGECFHVPPGLVHRDTNPTDEAHTGIVWLCGGEPWVVNVDEPGGSETVSAAENR
ncbi:cupin domain-containing protein [Natronococcus amylolyticus]|nr:cupin domain-containing protein [Natronococcus amylolyticus]